MRGARVEEHAGAAILDGERNVRLAVHANGLLDRRRQPIALCRNNVCPISVAVGEAPGDVPVRARDQYWRAGKREPVEIESRRAAVELQARPIPDRRHAQAEVHVARDQRRPRSGEGAGHNPPVAANRCGALGTRRHI